MTVVTGARARRIALAAQGFSDHPHATPTMRTLMRAVRRTQVLQIDSVNVVQRAHYLPLFSRIGAYDVQLLHRAASRPPRRLFEYWAHEAAYLPVELWPLMRHRMATAETKAWGGPRRIAREQPELVRWVLDQVRERGPVTAREIEGDLQSIDDRRRDRWGWNWSEAKQALEFLFFAGEVTVHSRTPQFERRYDVPERVIPTEVLALPVPQPADAHRELVRRAAASCGVATERTLRDYFRMEVADTRRAVAELVEAGELLPVQVEGWAGQRRGPAYLHRGARVPRRLDAAALLSPFDPVVWHRERAEELFGFRYRIEIYVPAERRRHGYYVLPFLLGDRLVARVDLKAGRAAGVLHVRAAYAEVDAPPETPERLAAALGDLAGWLGLGRVEVASRGDLSARLAGAVAAAPR